MTSFALILLCFFSVQSLVNGAAPTRYPTTEPTRVPTRQPTNSPTVAFSSPSEEPTQEPTKVPTALPTVPPTPVPSVPPSVVPTAMPTRVPTTRPTTAVPSIPPTAMPTVATVSMQVEQQVDGVSYSAYLADQASYDSVFVSTIAAAVGTPTDSVKNLLVTEASRRRASTISDAHTEGADPTVADTRLRVTHGVRHVILADAVGMQYSVEMPASSGVTYDEMSARLTHSVETNQFTELLQENAATQNVPALTTASSSSVETQNTTPGLNTGGGKDSTLSGGAIAGIVIGVCAAVLILVYFGFWFYSKNNAENTGGIQNLDTLQNRASGKSAPNSTRSANAFIYGTEGGGSGKGSGKGKGSDKSSGAVDDTKRFENPMRGAKQSQRAASRHEVGDNML